MRREALERDPLSFGASPDDDRAQSLDFLREVLEDPDQAIFGAFAPELVGVASIFRERMTKARHKTRIWGVYVGPTHRGAGLGKRLMQAAIDFARGLPGVSQVHLVVSSGTPAAKALYRSLGFRTWGVEPQALCINGELLDDEHMVKDL